jgi:midasin
VSSHICLNNPFRKHQFIYTPTSEQNMVSLALAVSQGHPVLLEGVTGSGKTTLVSHLASMTGNSG